PCPLVDGTWVDRHCGVLTTPIDEYPGGFTCARAFIRFSPSRESTSKSNVDGGAQMTSAHRCCSEGGTPNQMSESSGPATERSRSPGIAPEARRTISPLRWPKVFVWYVCRVPGSHHASVAARAEVIRVQSHNASSVSRC